MKAPPVGTAPANNISASATTQANPACTLPKTKLLIVRPCRTPDTNDESTERIGSTARNDFYSPSCGLLNTQTPLHRLYLEVLCPGTWTRQDTERLPGIASGPQSGRTASCPTAAPRRKPGCCKQMIPGNESGADAFAKPEEAMFADVAAQGHHADAAQQKIKQSMMRPPDVAFMALRAFNSHSWQSPENLWPG